MMFTNARKALAGVVILMIALLLFFIYADRNGSTSLKTAFLNKLKKVTSSDSMRIVHVRKESHNYVKGVLKFGGKSLDIFLYDRHDLFSRIILDSGDWERHWIEQLIKYLQQNPGTQLLDVGSNLGLYTLVAASLGHRVIAIDANKNNTDRLAQSLYVNGLSDKVTLMLNAVSNERKSFSLDRVPANTAAQRLKEVTNNSYQVNSILLDDILPFVDKEQNSIMKIDIEDHEIRAMQGASNLFDQTNIKFVLIEWLILKNNPKSYIIMNFFLSRNYKPYPDLFSLTELDISNYKAWPIEVVWRRI